MSSVLSYVQTNITKSTRHVLVVQKTEKTKIMKKCVLRSNYLLSKCNVDRVLLSGRFRFSTFSSQETIFDNSGIANPGYSYTSRVIQDKDLLRKSECRSGTGLHVLDLADNGSLRTDRYLYNQLLKICTRSGKLREARIVHAHILNSEFGGDIVMNNTIVNMYVKCGSLVDAQKVFDEMPVKDVVTWTMLITGYSQNYQAEDALVLFPLMLQQGLEPNQFTLSSLVKASGDSRSEKNGRQIHAYCFKCGYDSDVYVGSSLVGMYARFGSMVEAELVFDGLVSKNEVSWNTLISAHARKAEVEPALRLYRKMQREGFRSTPFTYSSLCTACASTGCLEQGKLIHAHVIKSSSRLVAFVGNTLLDMYAKSGSIEDAKIVFDRLASRDVVSWNSMLTAYAQHGLGKEAEIKFKDMLRTGLQPNGITFLCLLKACSHAGLLDEGQYYFESMQKYKVEPQISHYVTMVDLLGRAGLLDRAQKFIREMPVEPTAAIWGAMLGACKMHKNMELGAYAAEHIFKLDPYDSGPHVLLYNMYASAGRWDEASKVRKTMKVSGVKKEPACSWVEIGYSVHIFMAADDSHPQMEEIREMWEKISEKIKEIGYVPDSSHVTLFVEQQVKETNLQCHSEKLALAFALLKTPPESTIRIKKNIRVCGDCHTAIKYVSKVVGREIVVRDTNRFHHFRDGSCSCGDYW